MIAENDGSLAEEGENYFVSMTDMMIGVLFIFIIMLMVFALDFRTQTDLQVSALQEAQRLADRVNDLQNDIAAEVGALDRSEQARRELLFSIKKNLAAQGIEVEISKKSDVLRIRENAVRFRPNSADLDEAPRRNVATISAVLVTALQPYIACRSLVDDCMDADIPAIETVFIEGHTDRTGDERRNWELSAQRAANTYQEMVRAATGITTYLNRDRQPILSISGYSASRPIDRGDGDSAWALNRRIDLRFVMESDSRQRVEQLQKRTGELKGEIDALIKALKSE